MKQQLIPITGGLDLTSDKLSVPQGTAQACLNYHVGVRNGITRIKGFSKYDGRRVFADNLVAIYATSEVDASATSWTAGDIVTVTFDTLGSASAIVIAVTNDVYDPDGGGPGIPTYTHSVTAVLTETVNGLTSTTVDDEVVGISCSNGAITAPDPNTTTGLTSAASVYAYYAALIEALPGDSFTRLAGLHFFNDKLYAVTDLAAIECILATGQSNVLEGMVVYAAGRAYDLGTIALARAASSAANVIWELFDYAGDGDVSAGVYLYTPKVTANVLDNGLFDSGTGWTAAAGWTIGGGLATSAATGGAKTLTHALAAVVGYAYEITYTISGWAAGTVTASFGGLTSAAHGANGTFTLSGIATTTAALVFTADAACVASVDKVAVRFINSERVSNGGFDSGASWTAGTGWAIGSGVATATASSGTLTSATAAVSGLVYRLVYTITRTAGSVQATFGGASGTSRSSSGTYSEILTAASAAQLVFTGTSFTGTIDNVSLEVVFKIGEVVAHVEPTRAALYCTDWDGAGGWTRRDLGRLMAYSEDYNSLGGTSAAFFLEYIRRGFASQVDTAELQDTGWVGADSWESVSPGSRGWTVGAQTDLSTDDGAEVGSDGSSINGDPTQVLKAAFSTLSIPAGALVRRVQIKVRARSNGAALGTFFSTVQIGTSRGDRANVSGGQSVPNAETEFTFGGELDPLWAAGGFDPLLRPEEINEGFYAKVAFTLAYGPTTNVFVDLLAVKVYYQDQTRAAYINSTTNAPTTTEIEVVHRTIIEGTASDGTGGAGNRRGIIVLNPDVGTAAERWWMPAQGQQITTIGASLMAYVGGPDVPITLPASYALADAGSRYMFHSANPYASDLYDVTFICSGVECAYMFDGSYALPIHTGLLDQFEKPRHVVWAGTYLALGYRTGTLSISDVGNPLTFVDAASTAAEIGTSDRVTGLMKLKGDSLGVFTERTIFALQGADPSTSYTRIEISPASGAIEYSIQDIGQPVFLDYRGPATIATTDRYGDFNRGRLSGPATPWFIERLQLPTRNETVDRTFVASYLMRSENQVRYLFSDGWQATLTFGEDDRVHVTTQRYYGNWQSRDASAIKVLGVCHGTTSTGQDVAFMSFDVDPTGSRYRYAFQIDAGRSFDGEEIIAQWTSQPLQLGPPFFKKHLDQFGITGKAYGYAAIKVFKATDFETPVSDETTAASDTGTYVNFGTAASATEGNFKTIVTLRAEGEDVTVLLESISATELPHTIQNLVLRYEPEEPRG